MYDKERVCQKASYKITYPRHSMYQMDPIEKHGVLDTSTTTPKFLHGLSHTDNRIPRYEQIYD